MNTHVLGRRTDYTQEFHRVLIYRNKTLKLKSTTIMRRSRETEGTDQNPQSGIAQLEKLRKVRNAIEMRVTQCGAMRCSTISGAPDSSNEYALQAGHTDQYSSERSLEQHSETPKTELNRLRAQHASELEAGKLNKKSRASFESSQQTGQEHLAILAKWVQKAENQRDRKWEARGRG